MTSDDENRQNLSRPLAGIRVVECGVWHAGPGACAILADLGADVIKIEALEGDPERHHGNFGILGEEKVQRPMWNLLFEVSNRNKRGICVDIKTDEGQTILRQLVKDADVFVTNIRNSTKPKLRIDYESLRAINPRIIHLNVSGYGPEGPMRDVGGFDPMGQGISGMMFLGGSEEPRVFQVIILDQLTAITASHAVTTALVARERQGIGQEIHVSLYGSALWLLHMNIVNTSVLGRDRDYSWDRKRSSFARTTFRCGDGKWIIGTNHPEERYWEPFCRATGLQELVNDPRYDTKEKRAAANPELIEKFDAVFATKTRAEWLDIMPAHGVLFAAVNQITDVLADPQATLNGYLVDVVHPHLGEVRIPGYPVRFGAHHAGPRTAAPDLGEHTQEVLSELGYDVHSIEDLRRRKIVK